MNLYADSKDHSISFYFAIKAYRNFSEKSDLKSAPLAREIYTKFLKSPTGFFSFIDLLIREEINIRIEDLFKSPEKFIPNLFDFCLPDLYKFLLYKHTLFVAFYNCTTSKDTPLKDFIINNDVFNIIKSCFVNYL